MCGFIQASCEPGPRGMVFCFESFLVSFILLKKYKLKTNSQWSIGSPIAQMSLNAVDISQTHSSYSRDSVSTNQSTKIKIKEGTRTKPIFEHRNFEKLPFKITQLEVKIYRMGLPKTNKQLSKKLHFRSKISKFWIFHILPGQNIFSRMV